jgi:RecA-family ATPase
VEIVISLKFVAWKISEFFIRFLHIIYNSEESCFIIDKWNSVYEEQELSDLVRLAVIVDQFSCVGERSTLESD